MTSPVILGLATALPEHRHGQMDLYEQLIRRFFGPNRRYKAIFRASQIGSRYSVLEDVGYYGRHRSTRERNERYMAEAPALASQAVLASLDEAGLAPGDIDDLIVVSCTGFDTPGLDLILPGRLGMRRDLRRTFIGAMGCCAAFPGLHRAMTSVASRPDGKALVVSVELCSLHFQMDDSEENVMASALFGDGAAAVVVGRDSSNGHRPAGPRLVDTRTLTDYSTVEHMTFHVTDTGFRMVLSSYIPEILQANARALVGPLLDANGVRYQDVRFWGIHPGGAKILDGLQQALELTDDELHFSRKVMREKGNMSSTTILFVLEEIIRGGDPKPGDLGVLMAFGPGLTMESALVRW